MPDTCRASSNLDCCRRGSNPLSGGTGVPSQSKHGLFAQGMETRRAVLGDAHVDGAEASQTEFDAPFQALIPEGAWGSVWSRPPWGKGEGSLVTLARLAGLGHDGEWALRVR